MSKRITLNELEVEVLYKMVDAQIKNSPDYSSYSFHRLISLDIFRKLFDKLEAARFKEKPHGSSTEG